MFRKNPEAIDYWSQAYVLTCAQRQRMILAEAVKMLKPGGRLVLFNLYVCTRRR